MLPTSHGIYFGLLLLAMLLVAVNYNNGLAYAFTFLLSAMGLVSMLYTHRNLVGLRIIPKDADPVFVGQLASFPVQIDNPSPTIRSDIWLVSNQCRRRMDLGPQSHEQVLLSAATTRRGYLRCPVISISSAFPFGLFYTWAKPARPAYRCLVYPKPGPLLPWPAHFRSGGGREPHRGIDGDDFAGLRAYQSTDPPGHVHWKAAAHGQGLQTKRFGGATNATIWLDWRATHGPDIEDRIGILCRWVLDADAAGLRYGLRMPGVELAPERGQSHLHQSLRALALWRPPDV